MSQLSRFLLSILISLTFTGIVSAQVVLDFPPPPKEVTQTSGDVPGKNSEGISLAGYLYNRSTPRWTNPIGNWLTNAYRNRYNAAVNSYGYPRYIGYPIGIGYYPYSGFGFGHYRFGRGHNRFGSGSSIHFGYSDSTFNINVDL